MCSSARFHMDEIAAFAAREEECGWSLGMEDGLCLWYFFLSLFSFLLFPFLFPFSSSKK